MLELLKKRLGQNNGWVSILSNIFVKINLKTDLKQIRYDRSKTKVFPYKNDVFNAFKETPWQDVKVVIIGQDPYHNMFTMNLRGGTQAFVPYATGVAFGIPEQATKIPPSLRNIMNESGTKDQTLLSWARQGVLLLNTALTVKKSMPGSHTELWQDFTKEVLLELSKNKTGVIYVLWGNHARSLKGYINEGNNYILETTHPSPFSATKGFIGCGHFEKINEILYNINGEKIKW